jgi:hypothetical protein
MISWNNACVENVCLQTKVEVLLMGHGYGNLPVEYNGRFVDELLAKLLLVEKQWCDRGNAAVAEAEWTILVAAEDPSHSVRSWYNSTSRMLDGRLNRKLVEDVSKFTR